MNDGGIFQSIVQELCAEACIDQHSAGHDADLLPVNFTYPVLVLSVWCGAGEVDVFVVTPFFECFAEEFRFGVISDI